MASDSSYTTDSSSSVDSVKEKAIQTARQEIAATNRFDIHEKIGSGSYGDVFKVKDKERNALLALKIVALEDVYPNENDFWPLLQHPNIVPLLEIVQYSSAQVYLMPIMKISLYDVVHKTDFCDGTGSWKKLKKWLYQTLCGLECMHKKQFCHLDVKTDNVLISENDVAMLCDFSFIKSSSDIINKGSFGLPSIYRPPEARPYVPAEEMQLDGIAFDQWSFGIMTLEIFTNAAISDQVDTINESSSDSDSPSADLWLTDLYPVLMRLIRKTKFKLAVQKCFPNVKLVPKECRRALEFILVFLQPIPSQRWIAERGKRHAFLERGKLRLGRPLKEVWTKTDAPVKRKSAYTSTVPYKKLLSENSASDDDFQTTSRNETMNINLEEVNCMFGSLTLKKVDKNKSSCIGINRWKRKRKISDYLQHKNKKWLSDNIRHKHKYKESVPYLGNHKSEGTKRPDDRDMLQDGDKFSTKQPDNVFKNATIQMKNKNELGEKFCGLVHFTYERSKISNSVSEDQSKSENFTVSDEPDVLINCSSEFPKKTHIYSEELDRFNTENPEEKEQYCIIEFGSPTDEVDEKIESAVDKPSL